MCTAILGVVSKLYPSNKQRVLNKVLTRLMLSVVRQKKGSAVRLVYRKHEKNTGKLFLIICYCLRHRREHS